MKINALFFICFFLVSTAAPSFAWDGTDNETGNSVEVEKGQLVRTGNGIEYYDSSTGEYHSGTVESINRYGSTVEVEVTRDDNGETHTLEMEDN